MARPKKRAEMEVVYSNLKSATIYELNQVIAECEKLIEAKKASESKRKTDRRPQERT
jgi:hypothetical protein